MLHIADEAFVVFFLCLFLANAGRNAPVVGI
jgi:hypothetical protein